MDLDIKYLKLGLENCETITIDIENVEILDVKGITEEQMYRDGYKFNVTRRCKSVRLLLKEDRIYQPPYVKEQRSVFNRLEMYEDIVDISYLDKDKNTLDNIYVPWKDNSLGVVENAYQTSKRYSDGSMEIVIKEDI